MTRHELLCRMSGREFAGWMALAKIQAEEAEHARHVADSDDGVVHYYGREEDDEDDDDEGEGDEDDLTDATTE